MEDLLYKTIELRSSLFVITRIEDDEITEIRRLDEPHIAVSTCQKGSYLKIDYWIGYYQFRVIGQSHITLINSITN